MKAADFAYRRPADLADALAILSAEEGDIAPLAGGQSLMPMMNFRIAQPTMLLDLADVAELRGVTAGPHGLRIGAMTRYVQLAADPLVTQGAPLIGLALPHIAHAAIRNRGTIGGSVAPGRYRGRNARAFAGNGCPDRAGFPERTPGCCR